MKDVYIIIGIPGSGKDTQANLLSAKLNLPHIAAGKLFAEIVERKLEYWELISKAFQESLPIPSDVFYSIIFDKILSKECENGFILTVNSKSIDEIKTTNEFIKENGFEIQKVFMLNISKETALKRAIKRLNGKFTVKEPSMEALVERIENYNRIFQSVKEFYEKTNVLVEINGELPENEVFEKICEKISM